MPKWGLTEAQRNTSPWGLDPELLLPSKTLTDPVHGDVYLNKLEVLLVDSPPMQRLRRVRQLGTTHLVWEGANHSRLSHALGTLRAAQDLLDAAWDNQANPQSLGFPRSLIAEWGNDQATLDQHWAKATVLARLGALLHDLCHVPMGHTVEDDLGLLTPHDGNLARFRRFWGQLDPVARRAISPALKAQLLPLIISKAGASGRPDEYPFVADIVGNTICADLLDYLQRDHLFTGLPLSLGKRFLDSFFITDSSSPLFPKHMVIGIERGGRVRNDVVTELLKFLRYRYELTERVLTHHAKLAADAMLAKVLDYKNEDLQRLKLSISGHPDALTCRPETLGELLSSSGLERKIQREIAAELEDLFCTSSDDSLMESLAQPVDAITTARTKAAAIARALVDRRLYKSVGIATGEVNQANAEAVHQKFGRPSDRRELERKAAAYAEIDEADVAIWLPEPRMRLKVAGVLVYRERSIAPLSETNADSRAIAEQHRRLWGVTVFVNPAVRRDQQKTDALLAFVAEATGLTFRRRDGSLVPGRVEIAVEHAMEVAHGSAHIRESLLRIGREQFALAASQVGAERGDAVTFSAMHEALVGAARSFSRGRARRARR